MNRLSTGSPADRVKVVEVVTNGREPIVVLVVVPERPEDAITLDVVMLPDEVASVGGPVV